MKFSLKAAITAGTACVVLAVPIAAFANSAPHICTYGPSYLIVHTGNCKVETNWWTKTLSTYSDTFKSLKDTIRQLNLSGDRKTVLDEFNKMFPSPSSH